MNPIENDFPGSRNHPSPSRSSTRLAGSGPERAAIELDPGIGAAGRVAEGRTLAELRAERQRLEAARRRAP